MRCSRQAICIIRLLPPPPLPPPLTAACCPRLKPCPPATSAAAACLQRRRCMSQRLAAQQQQQQPARRRGLQQAGARPARGLAVRAAAAAAADKGPVVVVDNYDSFTYNLCQVCNTMGAVAAAALPRALGIPRFCGTSPCHALAARGWPRRLTQPPVQPVTHAARAACPSVLPAVPGRPGLRVRCVPQR